jgi:ABC-type phosphate transport system permease subunit
MEQQKQSQHMAKDLQDALSRVVHDRKAEKVVSRLQRIPSVVYGWFAYIYGLVHFTTKMNNPLLLLGVLVSTGLFVWLFNKYFSTRYRQMKQITE